MIWDKLFFRPSHFFLKQQHRKKIYHCSVGFVQLYCEEKCVLFWEQCPFKKDTREVGSKFNEEVEAEKQKGKISASHGTRNLTGMYLFILSFNDCIICSSSIHIYFYCSCVANLQV